MDKVLIGNFIVGKNSLADILRENNYQKYGLVISRVIFDALGLDEVISEALEGKEYQILLEVETETHMNHVKEGIEPTKEFQPDVLVAVGGGSVIDAAKLIWLFYELPETTWSDSEKYYQLPDFEGKADLIAVPTTSGTGSEKTGSAMFINDKNEKKMFLDNHLLPTYSVLDPTLITTLPDKPLMYSTLDSLTHALEAATNNTTNSITSFVGLQSILTIFKNLLPALKGNDEAREKLLVAASFSGIAINNSNVGISHALNYPGEDFKLPHGLITGMLTPYWIYEVGPHPFFETLMDYLSIDENTDLPPNKQFANILAKLFRDVGMPLSLREIGVSEGKFYELIPSYIDRYMNVNRHSLSMDFDLNAENIKNIFENMYTGTLFREGEKIGFK
ncbi:iron-containing alcohol dehydrogenase [Carnobacteriaceae bacterium 52-44]